MSHEQRELPGVDLGREGAAAEDFVDQLTRYDGPPEQFMQFLLRTQCEAVEAEAAVVLRADAEGIRVVAMHPMPDKDAKPPDWLEHCIASTPEVVRTAQAVVRPLHSPDQLYGQPARRRLVIVPLGVEPVHGAAAFVVEARQETAFAAARERLEMTRVFVSLYEARLADRQRATDLGRLRGAMEALVAVNEQSRFAGAAMAFANDVATRWQCERSALGFLKGRYVQLKALSHTEKFSRKMRLVQDIESAMEECLDQDVEVVHPAAEEATYVSRAAAELSARHGPTSSVSVPLRQKGEPVAVLTAERRAEQPFTLGEIEALRLACDLCTGRLVSLQEHDRWFGARAASTVRRGLAALVGPKHTWAKLIAVLVFAAAAFLVFAKGDYRAEAPFVLETTEQQVVPAPFDGYLKSVSVEPGEVVVAGTAELTPEDVALGRKRVLAELDTAELRLELAAKTADRAGSLKQVAAAMRDGKTVEAQIAQAEADKTAAGIRLIEQRISQAEITSPLGGVVVTGDLKRQIGGPVKTGDVLFEVAPIESLRALASVPEDLIADVIEVDRRVRLEGGEVRGELATAAQPDRRLRFIVERINPVAEVVDQKNVFKVRLRLVDVDVRDLRPGMEGVARIHISRERYAWIWSRRLVNWLRMKLWI